MEWLKRGYETLQERVRELTQPSSPEYAGIGALDTRTYGQETSTYHLPREVFMSKHGGEKIKNK